MSDQIREDLAKILLCVALVLSIATTHCAQAQGPPARLTLNSVSIPRLSQAPSLADFDNMRPRSAVARSMAKVSGFVQQQPSDGKPATQITEGYLGYDSKALYLFFMCFDTEPGKVRSHLNRRENLFDDDWIEVTLDTFRDKRHAFVFTSNPAGVQADALYTEPQGPDFSFDTVWNSQAHRTAQGYEVEMQIPFRSLRFRAAAEQIWGITILRNIPRLSEWDFWPYVSSKIAGRLNQAGTAEGIAGISPGRNLQFIPYGTFKSLRGLDLRDTANPTFTRRTAQFTGGLDGKAVFHDSLVLDATFNPDFSQVESDQPQQTVNQRFEVFFPEKRPFFLENSNNFKSVFSNMVFTRRIANPEYGLRLTGKLGKNNIGLLVTDDRSPGESVPAGDPLARKRAYFAIARLSRDIGEQNSIGVLYTDREFEGSFNRVGGVDVHIKIGKNTNAEAQTVYSSTRQLDGAYLAGTATKVDAISDGRKYFSVLEFDDITPRFRTEAGFVRRVDLRAISSFYRYSFRPEGKHLVSWGPQENVKYQHDHDGNRIAYHAEAGAHAEFKPQTQVVAVYGVQNDTLRPSDFTGLLAKRNYNQNFGLVFLNSAPLRQLSLNLAFTRGGNINFVPAAGKLPAVVNQTAIQAMVTVRPVNALSVENTYLLDRNVSGMNHRAVFNSHILRSKWNYQFTRELSLRFIAQYNSLLPNPLNTSLGIARNFNADALVTYLIHPGTAIYLGYNSNLQNLAPGLCGRLPGTTQCDANGLLRTNGRLINDGRLLFVKISYLFRF